MPNSYSQVNEHASLDKAIKSAEEALQQMNLAQDAVTRRLWSSRANAYLQEAERLKTESPIPNGQKPAQDAKSTGMPVAKKPRITRALPKSEQILLLRASYVNGIKYPPWSAAPLQSEFMLQSGEQAFIDDATFSISSFQQKVFAGWNRPDVALVSPTMIHERPLDLVQDAATDCSVVASLCAGVARQKRGHAKLSSSFIYPWKDDYPSMSQNGKYIVQLNFNGCMRRVVIDDRLPTSRTERFIHVFDRQNPGILWPALIEKAYLKIRGGYDFPGSNSATDLWIITGWIPEQVFLQDEDLDLDNLWSTVLNDWSSGDVLMTMGTGKISTKVEREVGLAGEHDYAVLELQEVEGQRLLLIKNPWCEGTSWHRVPERRSDAGTLDGGDVAQSPRDLLNAHAQLSPGTFWMDLNSVAQYFESIYLNWNPERFAFRQDLHFAWDLSTSKQSLPGFLHDLPQFQVNTADGGPVWLLLWRHLDKTSQTSPSSDAIDLNGFISLSAYVNDGNRVKLAGKAVEKSNIVDSPQILLKLDGHPPGQKYTIVAAEQELSRKPHTFTISAFSNSDLKLDLATNSFLHAQDLSASWTRDTAGGNANCLTYGTNPQFSIVLAQPTSLSILLQSHRDDVNVHIKLVHGNGKRIRAVRNRDVVMDSGDYRRSNCVAESKIELQAGTYSAICSTFEANQLSRFDLLVESDINITISSIPRDGAGRFTFATSATLPEGSTKIAARLLLKRMVMLSAIASVRSGSVSSGSQMRLSVEQGQASHRIVMMASDDDELSAARPGTARIDDANLSPDMLKYGYLWMIIARTCSPDRAVEQSIDIEMLVDQPDAIQLDEWTSVEE